MKTNKTKTRRGRRLGRGAWINAAREAFIKSGIEAVKVERLAKTLQATRAGFYYHFEDRDALLQELIKDWEVSNTKPFEAAINTDSHNGEAELEYINNMWLEEKNYIPAYDSAMRDWARVSKPVAAVVKRVDNKRIEILRSIFLDLGYKDPEALIRARIAYFHQVGYYTLGLGESKKTRRELAPLYLKALLGK